MISKENPLQLFEGLCRLVEENDQLREDFRDLFEEAPIPYVHEPLDTRFIRDNRAAMQVLGIKPEEIAGIFGNTFLANTLETQQRLREAFKSVETGRQAGGVELELRRKDNGKPVWVQWWSRPASNGSCTRTMGNYPIAPISAQFLARLAEAEQEFHAERTTFQNLQLVVLITFIVVSVVAIQRFRAEPTSSNLEAKI